MKILNNYLQNRVNPRTKCSSHISTSRSLQSQMAKGVKWEEGKKKKEKKGIKRRAFGETVWMEQLKVRLGT